MKERIFKFQSRFPFSAQDLFQWHERPGALERLTPPWVDVSLLSPPAKIDEEGSEVILKIKKGPLSFRWVLQHRGFVEGKEFTDVQIEGPFSSYRHRHLVTPLSDQQSEWTDEISYRPPIPFTSAFVEKEFQKLFSWRHKRLQNDLKLIKNYPEHSLRILVSGASGLIGKPLCALLQVAGHDVVRLVRNRSEKREDTIFWDPISGDFEKDAFEGFDAVIHLAGENIASKRWNKKRKETLFVSRCRDSWLLSQVLARLYRPPTTVICASAIGFYGNRPGEKLNEESAKGVGFLPDLCEKWESAMQSIENRGARVIHARFGTVLSPKGGMLGKLLLPFQCGLGGVIGKGDQIVNWIGIDDVVGGIYHALMTPSLSGAVNFTAPKAVSQREFTSTLAHKLHRPAFFPIPAFLLKMALGEMAEALLLSSTEATAGKLEQSGYTFCYPTLSKALDALI